MFDKKEATFREEGQFYAFSFPYDKDIISALCHLVPAIDREWDAERKVWRVEQLWFPDVYEMLSRHFELKEEA